MWDLMSSLAYDGITGTEAARTAGPESGERRDGDCLERGSTMLADCGSGRCEDDDDAHDRSRRMGPGDRFPTEADGTVCAPTGRHVLSTRVRIAAPMPRSGPVPRPNWYRSAGDEQAGETVAGGGRRDDGVENEEHP
jgi:hypothetical protein